MAIKIIIGLGNPGQEYLETRHNVGFMVLDYIAKKNDIGDFSAKGGSASGWEFDKKLNAEILKGRIDKTNAVLVKPHSFVNKTGEVVAKLKRHYKIKPRDIIIIQDDLDIPFGNTKLSFDRNSGGHKGIESIIKNLATKEFYRIRIGLSTSSLIKARRESDKKRDAFVQKFVLSKFTPKEKDELKNISKEAHEKIVSLM